VTQVRVTAILYSQHATRLRSLAIILPIHLFTITRVHVCNRIPIITIRMPTRSDSRVRALTLLSLFSKRKRFAQGIHEFTPLPTRHIIKFTIEITALKTTYRSMITASTDIDRFIIQLSTLMAAEKSSETNWHTRRATGDDDNYHDNSP